MSLFRQEIISAVKSTNKKDGDNFLEELLIFCEWEAPDVETLKKILAESGFPPGEVMEVEMLTPGECAWEIFGESGD